MWNLSHSPKWSSEQQAKPLREGGQYIAQVYLSGASLVVLGIKPTNFRGNSLTTIPPATQCKKRPQSPWIKYDHVIKNPPIIKLPWKHYKISIIGDNDVDKFWKSNKRFHLHLVASYVSGSNYKNGVNAPKMLPIAQAIQEAAWFQSGWPELHVTTKCKHMWLKSFPDAVHTDHMKWPHVNRVKENS